MSEINDIPCAWGEPRNWCSLEHKHAKKNTGNCPYYWYSTQCNCGGFEKAFVKK